MMRSGPGLIMGAVVVGAVAGCNGSSAGQGSDTRPRAVPAGARWVEAPTAPRRWLDEGYELMVPPIAAPRGADGRTRIAVFLRLPAHAQLPLTHREGRPYLTLPPGTDAARVEYRAPRGAGDAVGTEHEVLDVRATRLSADGDRYTVLRPVGTRLAGLEWPREPAVHQQVEAAWPLLAGEGALGRNGARVAARLQETHDCPGCHRPGRGASSGLVKRPADDHGFFQVSSVLWDDGPRETYRPEEGDGNEPFITWRCGEAPAPSNERGAQGQTRSRACPPGVVRWGRLHLEAARRAGDAHAEAVCASRRYLAQHMAAETRAVLRDAFAVCGIGSDGG